MSRICSANGKKGNLYRILVGKPEGMKQLGRPRRRWMDNIKIGLRYDRDVWTGLMWFTIGTALRLLWTR
jgi:hypothetical protein